MNFRLTLFIHLAIISALPFQAAAAETEWLLPNFANRLSVEVKNPGNSSLQALATLPVVKAQAVALNFPGRLALAVLVADGQSDRPATIIASQSDDLDGDGSPDEFEFPVDLPPHSQCRVDIYYSTTLEDSFPWSKRVSAKHSYGYNREVAALESESAGYRTYGGFFLDFHGRKAGAVGLWNDAAGYVPVQRDLGTGRDVLHIGATLGLGGVFLRRAGKIYQAPANVPTYAHKPSPEMVPHYRVVAQGPLRAIIEATLDNWQIENDSIRLEARYSIDAGERFVRCRVIATPVQVAKDHEYEVGIGVRDLPAGSVSSDAGQLIVTGRQNARDGDVGLAIYFDPTQYSPASTIQTADGSNHAVIGKARLSPGITSQQSYAAAGAWSGSGIANPGELLKEMREKVEAHAEIGALTFASTPHPEKVEAEPQ
ncbi:MAG TPA: DUF4861 family protein [Bryobacteraceae bacterium]